MRTENNTALSNIFSKEVIKMACNYFCDGVDKAPQRSLFNALGMTRKKWTDLSLVSYLHIMR